jgi:hypothetical protein
VPDIWGPQTHRNMESGSIAFATPKSAMFSSFEVPKILQDFPLHQIFDTCIEH